MNYDRLILDLLSRVSALEDKVAALEKMSVSDGESFNNDGELLANSRVTRRVYSGRDTTKYILDGKKYGKNRLVLAIVQKYMEMNDNVSSAKLMLVFDRSLQGSLGVIRTIDDVRNDYSDYQRRFFCQPDEIVRTTTEDCVVCTQWGKFNIDNIIARAKELGIIVTAI